jgi:hypothetical protein
MFFVGLDLGQKRDPSVLAVVEKVELDWPGHHRELGIR